MLPDADVHQRKQQSAFPQLAHGANVPLRRGGVLRARAEHGGPAATARTRARARGAGPLPLRLRVQPRATARVPGGAWPRAAGAGGARRAQRRLLCRSSI